MHQIALILRISLVAGAVGVMAARTGLAEEKHAPRGLHYPVRGVWVANVGSGVLQSPENSRQFVETCQRLGFNAICVVVWNRGYTVYPSQVMEREFGILQDPRYVGRDPLQELTEAAHQKNIRVLAWFEFGFASSYGKKDGGHILRRKPHWAARDADGKLTSKNGFQWMNAFYPEVQDFMLNLMKEVVDKYEVDGIQGDDRLPACPSTSGYDEWTVAQFAEEHEGRHPPNDHLQANWVDWRVQRLNRFAHRMHDELKAIDAQLVVAAAPSVFPWSRVEYLQDWPTWVARGWVDIVSPQLYRSDMKSYLHELEKVLNQQVSADDRGRFFPGILARTADQYRTTDEHLRRMIEAGRNSGIEGEIIFYDAALEPHARVFEKLYGTEDSVRPNVRKGSPR